MPQPRRSRRVIRKVDVWTVLRFSALLYASLLIITVVAGMLLWVIATATGVIDNVENFIKELFGFTRFHFAGFQILWSTVLGGTVLVLVGTGFNTLVAVLYNLITEVVGGIEVTVSERDPSDGAVV